MSFPYKRLTRVFKEQTGILVPSFRDSVPLECSSDNCRATLTIGVNTCSPSAANHLACSPFAMRSAIRERSSRAVEIEPHFAKEAKERQKAGVNGSAGGRGRKKNLVGQCPTRFSRKSRNQAASAVGWGKFFPIHQPRRQWGVVESFPHCPKPQLVATRFVVSFVHGYWRSRVLPGGGGRAGVVD